MESREASPSSIVSLTSQRHPEKLPEVTAQVEGTQGFLPQPETRGSLRTMHGGGSAPSCCAFTRVKALLESVPHVLTPGWSLITRLPLLSRATVESSPVLPSSGPHFFRVDGVTVTHLVRSSWEESMSKSCKLPPTVLDKRTGADIYLLGLLELNEIMHIEHLELFLVLSGASLVAQMPKNLPAMLETWV